MWFLQETGVHFLLVFEAQLVSKEQGHDRACLAPRSHFGVPPEEATNKAQVTCVDLGNRHDWTCIWVGFFLVIGLEARDSAYPSFSFLGSDTEIRHDDEKKQHAQ